MIVNVIERPVTFRAAQNITGTEAVEMESLVSGTGVRLRVERNQWRIEYPAPADCERGKCVTIWVGDWLVVSSLNKVRVLNADEFYREFVTV